jgi:hypothetical protein
MMSRTQIYLAPDEHRAARRRAAELDVSLAEYIRRLVRRDLQTEPRDDADASVLIDLGDSGGSDVANRKDQYVGEAAASEQRRE